MWLWISSSPTSGILSSMSTLEIYQHRINQLLQKLPQNSAALIAAAPVQHRNGDAEYPYRQDSYFYYLTGFCEPEAYLCVVHSASPQVVLFNRARDSEHEKWVGRFLGQQDALTQLAIDAAFDIDEFAIHSETLFAGIKHIYLLEYQQQDFEFDVAVKDLDPILSEMRLIKSTEEIALMQQAADISVAAHLAAMQLAKPGLHEYSLEAALLASGVTQGARSMGYEPIVASGANACTLHYVNNDQALLDGDLVLIDAGFEWQCYTADITRTFPVNGRFSKEQKALYEVVLQAQQQVIATIKPGLVRSELENITLQVLTEGLLKLGILTGDLSSLLEQKAVRQFYYHGVSHWLGLDVHDVGSYKIEGEDRALQAGMVLTVEPGLYMNPSDTLDQKWHGIGIRIEDDVLVTEQGHRVLSAALPKTVADIEAVCAN